MKLAWIISGLALGTSLLFACPTPVPKLSPLLVPVNSSSVAALDFYIPQTDDDKDTYDIVTGDPTITAVTPSPADANSPENGGTWDGVATIAWSKPGKYNVAVTISATWWDEEKEVFCDTSYTKTFCVTVVDVKSIDVWGDGDRHAAATLLEVVPPITGEDISGNATMNPDVDPPSGQPVWTYALAYPLTGKAVKFAEGAKGYLCKKTLLNKVIPFSSAITCTCGGTSWNTTISRFPCDVGTVNASTEKLSKWIGDKANTVLSWISGLKIEAPTAKFDFNNQWKEQPNANTAIWVYDATPKWDPLLSVSGKALTIQPPKIKKLVAKIKKTKIFEMLFKDLDVDIAVSLDGKIKSTVHFQKDINGKCSATVIEGDHNEIGATGSADFKLIPKIKMTIDTEGEVGDTFVFTVGAYGNDDDIGLDWGIGQKGLTLKAKIIAEVPGFKDPVVIVDIGEKQPFFLIDASETPTIPVSLYKF